MPSDTTRTATDAAMPAAVLVAWCRNCEHYVGSEEIGTCCPADCGHKLVKRRGFICEECECKQIYFDKLTYLNHSHCDCDGHLLEGY